MKQRPRPATLEEEDSDTGEARPNTRTSASLFSPTKGSFPTQRSPRIKPCSSTLGYMRSTPLGSILDAVSLNSDGALLSILAGEHDDNHLVWKESGRYRVFFYPDRVINDDAKTHIIREITISRLDLATPSPKLIIGQRVYTTFGTVELKAHQLHFGPGIDVDRPYAFHGLGDEIPGVGCPDLHCTFRIVSDWESTARQADTSRFDQNVSIDISLADVQADRNVTYDIQNNMVANRELKPVLGM